jgi:Tfp pilus assembly protein PilO
MSLLLGLVPWWARLVAMLAVVAALFGYGYVKGLKSGEERLADYEAKTAQLAAQQQVATAKTVAAQ